jgi:hypothetical protein
LTRKIGSILTLKDEDSTIFYSMPSGGMPTGSDYVGRRRIWVTRMGDDFADPVADSPTVMVLRVGLLYDSSGHGTDSEVLLDGEVVVVRDYVLLNYFRLTS